MAYRAGGSDGAGLQKLMGGECSAQITLAKCDTSFLEEARAALNAAAERQVGGCGLGGVLLAGGVLNDAMLPSQTAGEVIAASSILLHHPCL